MELRVLYVDQRNWLSRVMHKSCPILKHTLHTCRAFCINNPWLGALSEVVRAGCRPHDEEPLCRWFATYTHVHIWGVTLSGHIALSFAIVLPDLSTVKESWSSREDIESESPMWLRIIGLGHRKARYDFTIISSLGKKFRSRVSIVASDILKLSQQ